MRSDLIHLLTELEIGVPKVSAAVDDKLFLGVSWTFLNHWTHLTHCRFLLYITSRVSIYRMCCKCYKLSALAAVDGNSTFRNFTLNVARRKGAYCNSDVDCHTIYATAHPLIVGYMCRQFLPGWPPPELTAPLRGRPHRLRLRPATGRARGGGSFGWGQRSGLDCDCEDWGVQTDRDPPCDDRDCGQ